MGTYMLNTETIMEADHFIMLDVSDTLSGNEFDRSYPYVQIVYPSNQNTYLDNQHAESHPENRLTYKQRGKYLFTITLNVDADY